MFRVKLYIFILLIPLAFLVTACSKSDTATAPDNAPVIDEAIPVVWANGKICLQPELTFNGTLHTLAGTNHAIDSIFCADTLLEKDVDWFVNYQSVYYDVVYDINFTEATGDGYMLSSGDKATVKVYGDGGMALCSLTVLDYDGDKLELISPSNGTSVMPGSSIKAYWHKIPHAEWYAIYQYVRLVNNGHVTFEYIYDYTYDTTYTYPAAAVDDSADYSYLYVQPVTGPDPESGLSNWHGLLVTGKIYSVAKEDNVRVNVNSKVKDDTDGIVAATAGDNDIAAEVYDHLQ